MFRENHQVKPSAQGGEEAKPSAQGGASANQVQDMSCLRTVFEPLKCYRGWKRLGLRSPVFSETGDMMRARFSVVNGLSSEQQLVIDVFPVDPKDLPRTLPQSLCKYIVDLLAVFLPGHMFCAPPAWIDGGVVVTCLPDGMWVVVVFAMEFDRDGMKKYREAFERHQQRENWLKEKQLDLERKQTALEKEASQRGFPDVASMQAADANAAAELAEAERQRKIAAEQVRQNERRAQEQAEATQIAEEARKRKAEKDAAVAAAHQAFLAEQEATRQARLAEQEARKAKRCKGSPPRPPGGKAVGKR
jgi:hypothetical protein